MLNTLIAAGPRFLQDYCSDLIISPPLAIPKGKWIITSIPLIQLSSWSLTLIAHAWNLVLHSLHCTDKCPVGRSSPWPRLNLAPTSLPSLLYQRDGRFDDHPESVG